MKNQQGPSVRKPNSLYNPSENNYLNNNKEKEILLQTINGRMLSRLLPCSILVFLTILKHIANIYQKLHEIVRRKK